MKFRVKKSIANATPYVPGKPIDEVKRELGLKDVIKLASNENPFGPSPKVLKAILDASKSVNRYPPGDCFYLRKVLAKRLSVPADHLVFGNGSDELLVLCIRLLVGDGDEVLIAQPSFLIYDIAARLAGAKVVAVPLKGFHYDIPAMTAAVTDRTRIIFIGNPDNPGGKYIPDSQLVSFVGSVPGDVLIVIDEAYYEYVSEGDYGRSVDLLKKHDNILITRTFSKLYGLAGLRIGYGICRPDLAALIDKIREPFNVNSLAQAAALACLKDQPYYKAIAKKIAAERRALYSALKDLGLEYVPSFTNFLLIKLSKDSTQVANALMREGVIVRDMSHWGLKNYIRVSIGTQKENKRFIRAMEEIL